MFLATPLALFDWENIPEPPSLNCRKDPAGRYAAIPNSWELGWNVALVLLHYVRFGARYPSLSQRAIGFHMH